MSANRIVFMLVCAITLFWAGLEAGRYVEQRAKDNACVAISLQPRLSSYDMTKAQRKRWIKYYMSKGEV